MLLMLSFYKPSLCHQECSTCDLALQQIDSAILCRDMSLCSTTTGNFECISIQGQWQVRLAPLPQRVIHLSQIHTSICGLWCRLSMLAPILRQYLTLCRGLRIMQSSNIWPCLSPLSQLDPSEVAGGLSTRKMVSCSLAKEFDDIHALKPFTCYAHRTSVQMRSKNRDSVTIQEQ